ncbi:hypothetical protein ACLIJR_08655 [Hydrogenophaga sp. XSHU_21]
MNRLGARPASARSSSVSADHAASSGALTFRGSSTDSADRSADVDPGFIDAVGAGPTVLSQLPLLGTGARFDDLAQQLGLAGPDQIDAFRVAFATHMRALDLSLTPQEANALQALSLKLTLAAEGAPTERGRMAQGLNSTRAATLAWASGFGLVSLIVKLAQHNGLGGSAIHLVNLAGPLILMGSEILAGKYRAEGAGYAAADSIAYQSRNQQVARLAELSRARQGALAARPPSAERIAALDAKIEEAHLAIQRVLADLIVRELGAPLRVKSPDAAPDVPLACLRSGLQADAATGQVRLPDGSLLFTVVIPFRAGRFDVVWPDGSACNLLAETVAPAHQAMLSTASGLLFSAAQLRALVCDEGPFLLFGAFYAISGALGPYLLNTLDNRAAAVASDTLLSVGMAFFGTQSLVHAQNLARSLLSGKRVSPGAHAPERVARLEQAEFTRSALLARLSYLKGTRAQLDHQLSRDGQDADGPAPTAEERDELRAARSEVKRAIVTVLREVRASEQAVAKAGSKLDAVAFNVRAGWSAYLADAPLLVARLAAYTIPYLFYSQVFMQQIQVLYPTGPASAGGVPPGPDAPGNFSVDPLATNATLGSGSLEHYMAANAFNGFVMAIPFMFRNLALSRVIEQGIHLGIGEVRHWHERLWQAPPAAGETAADEVTTLAPDGAEQPQAGPAARRPVSGLVSIAVSSDSSSSTDSVGSSSGPIKFKTDID